MALMRTHPAGGRVPAMSDLLLPTYATVLALPALALVAYRARATMDERRRRPRGDGSDPVFVQTVNAELRRALLLFGLATGTTASLWVSGALLPFPWGASAVAGALSMAALVMLRLVRAPHFVPLRAVSGAAAWWGAFGLLGGFAAQALVQGGLAGSAVLIALLSIAAAQGLAADGRLAPRARRFEGDDGSGPPG